MILENLRNLCNIHDHVIARIPLVEGFNTDDEALESMFSFADECGAVSYTHLGMKKPI